MIIYNVTIKIDWAIYEDWLRWMKEEQVPAILKTGLFLEHRVMRLLDIDDAEGPTFAVQYFAVSLESYNQYLSEYRTEINQKEFVRWGNRMVQFSTVMQLVV